MLKMDLMLYFGITVQDLQLQKKLDIKDIGLMGLINVFQFNFLVIV